ncbi:MAG: cupin domain-containing protein [Candidatus Obscuribacterales bacterium]
MSGIGESFEVARVHIPASATTIEDGEAIAEFLAPHHITYEVWPVAGRLPDGATDAQILDEYASEIETLKKRGGYVTADVINVTPETPGLDAMLDKFNKEHTHSEDEVRFVVAGSGIFHIHSGTDGTVFSIEMMSGDLINVPAGTRHWFNLCKEKTIKTIRLFQEITGWSPQYVDAPVHGRYEPLCFGPTYSPIRRASSVINP